MSEFQPALPFESLQEGFPTPVEINGVALALYLLNGKPYCTDDLCSHEDNFLSAGGYVDGDEVECAFHGARFDIKTGSPTQSPASYPIRTFPVEVRDGQVYVAVD
ncbi:MAG: non-heme iron oxygenase ferredoxin subunit [Dehalococcoidia bacterium]